MFELAMAVTRDQGLADAPASVVSARRKRVARTIPAKTVPKGAFRAIILQSLIMSEIRIKTKHLIRPDLPKMAIGRKTLLHQLA